MNAHPSIASPYFASILPLVNDRLVYRENTHLIPVELAIGVGIGIGVAIAVAIAIAVGIGGAIEDGARNLLS